MNEHSAPPGRPATRAPVFFWIAVALLALLLLGGVAGAVLLVIGAGNINRSGGWGWLLVIAIYVVAITVVCFSCALCTAISLFRRERHRRLSIAILIISCLVVLAFGPNLIRGVQALRRQHDEKAKPASLARYSLVPRMLLRIQQEDGRVGRSFLIGEQHGKWYIITMAGHTT